MFRQFLRTARAPSTSWGLGRLTKIETVKNYAFPPLLPLHIQTIFMLSKTNDCLIAKMSTNVGIATVIDISHSSNFYI